MSCFGLHVPKKLQRLPSSSKKVWHSFTSSLQPKLHNLHRHLKIPKSVARTTNRLLQRRPCWQKPPRGGSRLSYSYSKQYPYRYQYQYQHLQHSEHNSPATVYVDRLFLESSSSRTGTTAEVATKARSGGGGEGTAEMGRREKESGGGGGGVRWKEYISSLPRIRGIDERAEEFIFKFRQQMQLQRQQSILDFHDMLARSA